MSRTKAEAGFERILGWCEREIAELKDGKDANGCPHDIDRETGGRWADELEAALSVLRQQLGLRQQRVDKREPGPWCWSEAFLRQEAGDGVAVVTAQPSQLERDLGLIGRWLLDGHDERRVSLVRHSGLDHFSIYFGRAVGSQAADGSSTAPDLADGIHGIAVVMAAGEVTKHENLMRSAIKSRGVIGDWTEGGTR